MKIKRNNEENINQNSKNSLTDFRKKQIIMNILYHKIFFGMCIFVNICLFIFIMLYSNQLQEIETITQKNTREYRKNNYYLSEQQKSINHKIVNLLSINRRKNLLFSYSFSNKIEFEMVKNFITEYYRNNPLQYDEHIFDDYKLHIIYSSITFDINYNDFTDILNYHRNALFIIHSVKDQKFGIYVDEPMIFNEDNEFISNENRLFIFSFQSKSMHKYIGKGPALKINRNKILEIGNEEIIIYGKFYNNGGYINYTLESFENLNKNENFFAQKNGKFDIKYIEIFAFYLDMNKIKKKFD